MIKQFFSIGKDTLNKLINPIQLKKEKKIVMCKYCKFFKTENNKFKNIYCNEYCQKKYETILINNLLNKKTIIRKNIKPISIKRETINNFILKKSLEKRETYITSAQLKTIITYYTIANNKGIINSYKISDLAKLIGVSSATINNSNEKLELYGFIKYQKTDNRKITVIINNYNSLYEQKGAGYILFSNKLLKSLYSISNIHLLRVILKAIVNFDSNHNFNKKTLLKYEKIKYYLPKYKQKTFALENFIKMLLNINIKGINITKHMFNYLNCDIKEDFIGKDLKLKIIKTNTKQLLDFIFKENILFKNNQLICKLLANLSLNYHINDIKYILKNTSSDILYSPINNVLKYIHYHLINKENLI